MSLTLTHIVSRKVYFYIHLHMHINTGQKIILGAHPNLTGQNPNQGMQVASSSSGSRADSNRKESKGIYMLSLD